MGVTFMVIISWPFMACCWHSVLVISVLNIVVSGVRLVMMLFMLIMVVFLGLRFVSIWVIVLVLWLVLLLLVIDWCGGLGCGRGWWAFVGDDCADWC